MTARRVLREVGFGVVLAACLALFVLGLAFARELLAITVIGLLAVVIIRDPKVRS